MHSSPVALQNNGSHCAGHSKRDAKFSLDYTVRSGPAWATMKKEVDGEKNGYITFLLIQKVKRLRANLCAWFILSLTLCLLWMEEDSLLVTDCPWIVSDHFKYVLCIWKWRFRVSLYKCFLGNMQMRALKQKPKYTKVPLITQPFPHRTFCSKGQSTTGLSTGTT